MISVIELSFGIAALVALILFAGLAFAARKMWVVKKFGALSQVSAVAIGAVAALSLAHGVWFVWMLMMAAMV